MRGTSLRMLSAIAASARCRMRRWDFVSAYLQGDLEAGEVVYCLPPPGHAGEKGADGQPRVCKVLKPIYGMAQAGRRWQRSLFPWLLEQGFTAMHADACVFHKTSTISTPKGPREETVYVGVYVDDLTITYKYDEPYSLYSTFTKAMVARWKVEDEGDIEDLLGVEFSFSDKAITLKQTAYIERMVREYLPDGIPDTIQVSSLPCDKTLPQVVADALSCTDAPDPALLKRYQSIVGALLYAATNTRPDIAFAVNYLCRAMSRPSPELLERAYVVLAYLARHKDIGLCYEADGKPLRGQSDSDWGVQHSITGWLFKYSSACVSWGSKKQSNVALSSCEAEIMAGSEASKEGVYPPPLLR